MNENCQGRGYGRKLVEYVESEGKYYGMRRSYANNVMQQAAWFWKKMGYEELKSVLICVLNRKKL